MTSYVYLNIVDRFCTFNLRQLAGELNLHFFVKSSTTEFYSQAFLLLNVIAMYEVNYQVENYYELYE